MLHSKSDSRGTRGLARRLLMISALLGFGGLTGCAAPIVAGLTGAQIFSLAGLSATIMTGRDLTEHVVSVLTGKDCRFLETLLRNGRSFCETSNTLATRDDFQGVFGLTAKTTDASTKVAAANIDPEILGFAPVDRRAAADFSLEIARHQNDKIDAPMLSFGMLSASFGSSFSYELNLRQANGESVNQFAMAEPTAPPARRTGGTRAGF